MHVHTSIAIMLLALGVENAQVHLTYENFKLLFFFSLVVLESFHHAPFFVNETLFMLNRR